jgi:hypothetical protein
MRLNHFKHAVAMLPAQVDCCTSFTNAAALPTAVRSRAGEKSMPELIALLLLAGAGWFLWDSLKARETANAAMRAACRDEGWLFLDDTVSLQSIRPVRDDDGHLALRRIYDFEYSDTGHNRRQGNITMIADAVAALSLGPRPVNESESPR